MSVAFVCGGAFLKAFAQDDHPVHLGIAIGAYVIGNILFFTIVDQAGLARATTLSAAATVALSVAVGVVRYGEVLSTTQALGVIAVIAGAVMVTTPAST